jgi:hypothetical protein
MRANAALVALLAFIFLSFDGDPVINAKMNDFLVDNLGNIYVIHDEELVKFTPAGKKFASYSNLRLGKISHVDVMNPLKILVYYRDFQQIVFLDNQLSVNSEPVSLEKLGLQQTLLVAASTNNSFWLYDRLNNELQRFNEFSKRTGSTGNLKQVLGTDINPSSMREFNGHLYLSDTLNGIYVFDLFSTFIKAVPLKKVFDFTVDDTRIYYTKGNFICNYDQRAFAEDCLPLKYTAEKIRLMQKKVYYGFRDSIIVRNP